MFLCGNVVYFRYRIDKAGEKTPWLFFILNSSTPLIWIIYDFRIVNNRRKKAVSPECTLSKEPQMETGFDTEFGWRSEDRVIDGLNLFKTRHRQQLHDNFVELFHAFVELN